MRTRYVLALLPVLFRPSVLSGAEADVTAGLNRFALASYRELSRASGNLIFSPLNIATALSLALAGARGETAEEMARVLHEGTAENGYNAALAGLLARLAKDGNSTGNQLLTANNIWVQKGLPVRPEFRQTIEGIFRTPFTPLDFATGADDARLRINRWTAEQTHEHIPHLFGPGVLTPATRMVLTSAIYFNGNWESPFKPASTHTDAFALPAGGSVQTPFMNQTGVFGYREEAALAILEMRYKGTPLAFDILLPKDRDGLAGVERSLTPENLTTWLQLEGHQVQVSLPKFRSESDLSLRNALSGMGMARAFNGTADFSGIDGRRDLRLDKVVHKAFVDVSETGTEAAAATGASVALIATLRRPQPIVFRADHPFLFFIRDTHSGAILFAGRLANPASGS
jgi:serpin B